MELKETGTFKPLINFGIPLEVLFLEIGRTRAKGFWGQQDTEIVYLIFWSFWLRMKGKKFSVDLEKQQIFDEG